MAVQLIATIHKYIGAAADVKPTTNVPVGSEFYEYDTGKTYIYNGSAWSEK